MNRKENLSKYANLLHNAATKNTIKATGETVVEDVENTVGIPETTETTVELVETKVIEGAEINSKERIRERIKELKYKIKKSGEARRFKQYLETKQNTEVPEMTHGIHDVFNFL